MDYDESVLKKITDFLQKIEIPFVFGKIEEECFLPGLRIDKGVLYIDKTELKYVGDVLHEAGHIALLTPEQRANEEGKLSDHIDAAALEMAAIAWSYAVCLEIEISPYVVFHPDGYKGQSEQIVTNFNNGYYFGVPILEWLGMTDNLKHTQKTNPIPFPKMVTWIRPSKTT